MYILMQAYYQSGEIDESMPHFQRALFILDTHLPRSAAGALLNLAKQAMKQLLHCKFPHRFLGSKRSVKYSTT